MERFTLVGGPMDGKLVSSESFNADGILHIAYLPPASSMSVSDIFSPPPSPRHGVYQLKTLNNEDQIAEWVGWQDEINQQPPGPLAKAMMNATDDEILELMDSLANARRK